MRHTRRIRGMQDFERAGAVPGRTPLAMRSARRLVAQRLGGSDAVGSRNPGLRGDGTVVFRRVRVVRTLCHFDQRTPCVSLDL